ncbi:MAG: tetratricopeptide repeat protein [Thermoplasmata archaeon]
MSLYVGATSAFFTEFVDREEETIQLMSAVREAAKGHGKLFLVGGPAGIGKTRLVEEIARQASPMGFKYLKARCFAGADPYLPFVAALAPFGITGIISEQQMEKEEDVFSSKIHPASGGQLSHVAELNKAKMFEATLKLILNLSERHPLLMFFDNLQWADTGSLTLLHYISRNIRNSRVLIIGGYRSDEITLKEGNKGLTLADFLDNMGREGIFSRIYLRPLSRLYEEQMLTSMFHGSKLPEGLVGEISQKSGGNPYYSIEIVKYLLRENILTPEDVVSGIGTGSTTRMSQVYKMKIPFSEVRLPGTLYEIVSSRLARLPPELRKVIEWSAVLGYEFSTALIERVSGMERMAVLRALMELEKDYNLIESYEDGFRFLNPIIKHVVYTEIPKNKVKEYHRAAAERLESYKSQLGQKDIDPVFQIASHYASSGDVLKGVSYSIKAGDKARSVFAYNDALVRYSVALQFITEAEKQPLEAPASAGSTKLSLPREEIVHSRITVLDRMAYCNAMLANYKEAIENYDEILKLARSEADASRYAEALRAKGHLLQKSGRLDEALECFKEALPIAESLVNLDLEADIYRGLGRIYWKKGLPDKAMACLEKAHENADRVSNQLLKGLIYIEMGNVMRDKSEWDKGLEYYTKAEKMLIDRAEALPDLARLYNNMGVILFEKKEVRSALEHYQRAADTARKISDIFLLGIALSNIGEIYAKEGNYEKCAPCLEEALAIFKKIGDSTFTASVYKYYAAYYRKTGDYANAEANFLKAIKIHEQSGVVYDLAETRYEYAVMLYETGRFKEALTLVNMVMNALEELGAEKLIIMVGEKRREILAALKSEKEKVVSSKDRLSKPALSPLPLIKTQSLEEAKEPGKEKEKEKEDEKESRTYSRTSPASPLSPDKEKEKPEGSVEVMSLIDEKTAPAASPFHKKYAEDFALHEKPSSLIPLIFYHELATETHCLNCGSIIDPQLTGLCPYCGRDVSTSKGVITIDTLLSDSGQKDGFNLSSESIDSSITLPPPQRPEELLTQMDVNDTQAVDEKEFNQLGEPADASKGREQEKGGGIQEGMQERLPERFQDRPLQTAKATPANTIPANPFSASPLSSPPPPADKRTGEHGEKPPGKTGDKLSTKQEDNIAFRGRPEGLSGAEYEAKKKFPKIISDDTFACPVCANVLKAGWKSCPVCGTPVNQPLK